MRSMSACLRVCGGLLLLVVFTVLPARAQLTERGQWMVTVPEVGDLTLSLRTYQEKREATAWWLFDDRRFAWSEEEGRIRLYRHSWKKDQPAELLFQLRVEADGSLVMEEAGAIDAERLKWWQGQRWRPIDRKTEANRRRFDYASRQRPRFTERGNLQPFPATFPSAFVETTAWLFLESTNEINSLLTFAGLSASMVRSIGEHALAQAKESGWMFVLPRVAAHPHCPPEMLARLFARSDDPAVWRAAALNPAAPASYRESYLLRIKTGTEGVRFGVARDTLAPREAWELALAPGESGVLGEFARNKAAPPDLLAQVAARQNGTASSSLAANPQSPPEVLEALIGVPDPATGKPDKQVLWALKRNPSASPAQVERVLRILAASESQSVRATAVEDARLPVDLFPKFAAERSIHLRLMTAMNRGAPEDILAKLAGDPYREVSSRARDNLKERFPATWSAMQEKLPALDALNPAMNLMDEFLRAFERVDVETVRACLADQDDPEERIGVGMLISNALRKHFAEFRPLLTAEIRRGGDAARHELVAAEPLRAEHVAWLKTEGFLAPPWGERILLKAAERADVDLARALLDARIPVEPADFEAITPLMVACSRRNLPMVRLLLDRGADRAREFRSQTAADFAAQVYFITGLRNVDSGGRYKKMLDDFDREFPSTRVSACRGVWSNRKDGFSTVNFALDADGTGFLGAAISAMPIAWRQESDTELVLFAITPAGVQRDKPIRMHFDVSQQTLTSTGMGEGKQTFHRIDHPQQQ